MRVAVTIGTTSFIVRPTGDALPGTVIFEGEWPTNPVWDDALQTVREKNAAEKLAEAKIARYQNVKAEAEKRIAALVGADHANEKELWQKENNAQARATYLARKESNGTATAEELAEIELLQNIGLQGLAIREASNTIEADIDTKTTIADVETYDIAGSPLWP